MLRSISLLSNRLAREQSIAIDRHLVKLYRFRLKNTVLYGGRVASMHQLDQPRFNSIQDFVVLPQTQVQTEPAASRLPGPMPNAVVVGALTAP